MAQSVHEHQSIDEELETVRFTLGGKPFVLDVGLIDGIEEVKSMTRVPRAALSVTGVVDIRGDIVVVIDPKEFLGEGEKEENVERTQRIILLDTSVDNQRVAFIVDSVVGVDEFTNEHLEAVNNPDEFDDGIMEEGYVESLLYTKPGENDGEVVGLINVEKIIDDSQVEL